MSLGLFLNLYILHCVKIMFPSSNSDNKKSDLVFCLMKAIELNQVLTQLSLKLTYLINDYENSRTNFPKAN